MVSNPPSVARQLLNNIEIIQVSSTLAAWAMANKCRVALVERWAMVVCDGIFKRLHLRSECQMAWAPFPAFGQLLGQLPRYRPLLSWDSAGWEEPGKLIPKDFNSCRHSISRIHTATATRARAGITLDATLPQQSNRHDSTSEGRKPSQCLFHQDSRVQWFPPWRKWPNIILMAIARGQAYFFITAPIATKASHYVRHGGFDRVCDDVT